MLGISSISSASGTAEYFAKDNYYSSEQGHATSEWFGKGAEDLGLTGSVNDKDLLNALEGNFGDQEKGKGKHNPGRDLTFSMPKSASILALIGGDTRITDAYMMAVKETLSYAEKNLIVTRQRGEGNKRQSVKTGNIVTALFPHDTSRLGDANAHIHALIMNGTKNEDGKYVAINFKQLYNVRYELNQMAHERFRHFVHKLGYKTVDKDKGGHWDIVGVGQNVIDAMSKRRGQIEAVLSQINDPSWNQRQTASYVTRPGKVIVDRSELMSKWKSEVKKQNFDAEKFVQNTKPANQQSLWAELKERMSVLFASRHQSLARENLTIKNLTQVTGFVIRALSEKNTIFSRTQIVAEVSAITQGSFTFEQIDQNIENVQKKDDLQAYQEDKYAGEQFTTKTLIRTEEALIQAVKDGQGKVQLFNRTDLAEKLVSETTLSIIEKVEPKTEDKDKQASDPSQQEGYDKLSKSEQAALLRDAQTSSEQYQDVDTGQKVALEKILFSQDKIIGVQGFAGAGKTKMLETLNEMAKELNTEQNSSHEFIGLAPTIPATKELEGKVAESGTFQKFQFEMAKNPHSGPSAEMIEKYKGKSIVLDEGSMLSVTEMDSFIKNTQALGVEKVIIMGDTEQIQSLNAGAAFKLMQKVGMDTAIVDYLWRQKDPTIFKAVKHGIAKDIDKSFEELGNFISNHKDMTKAVAREYLSRLKQGREVEIITPANKTIDDITVHVRQMLKDENLISSVDHKVKTAKSLHLSENDKKVLSNYSVGDVVAFHKTLVNDKFRAGDNFKVTAINKETNVISLHNTDTGRTKKWLLDSSVKQFPYDVVKEQHKSFSEGDKIRFTENHKDSNIERHDTGKITKIGDKMITVEDTKGNKHQFLKTSKQARSLTHNYATTVFANQGKSIKETLVALSGRAFSTTYENFYVAISRAVEYLHVFTDDKSQLEKTVAQSARAQADHAIEYDGSDRTNELVGEEKQAEAANELSDIKTDDPSKSKDEEKENTKSDENTKDEPKTDNDKDNSKDNETEKIKETAGPKDVKPMELEFRDMPEDRSIEDRSR